ncbi:MAG: fumarylacetoacetate hydrolase family protein [Bryobacteraceae bacterium]
MDLSELARRQLADYDAHHPGLVFRDASSALSIAEAYAVQRQVAALRVARGEPVAGYKIGCVSEPVQRQLGIDRPVFGYVFGSELHASGVALDAACFEGLAIEGEFAVRIAEDIPDPEWVIRHPERAIGEVLPVIELHNNVFRGATRTAAELIANNALHAGVVLPAGGGSRELRDRIAVFRNGEELGVARAEAIPGGLLESVRSVAVHVASWGGTLRRGDLVLTGSPLPLYAVAPGDSIWVRTERCGEVRAVVV